jgi:type IV pilus assembly protein PilY1
MNTYAASKPVRYLRVVAGLVMAAGAGAALSQPSQSPLVSRSSPPPQPNVMVTIDDSGSMLFDFMPEQAFTVNGKSVQLAESIASTAWPQGFPGDPTRTVAANGNTYIYQTGTVTATKGAEGIFQKQFRSPDINSMYYNPDIRYRPWIDANNIPNDMTAGVKGLALWDPRLATTFDIVNKAKYPANGVKWCADSYTGCAKSGSDLDFFPGLVYRLTAGADPTLSASYTRYDINGNNGDAWAPTVKNPNRTDCAGNGCTQAEELQNFANWFTYYRNRQSIVKAALGRTLTNFKDKIRLGWARFHPDNPGALDSTRNVQQAIKAMDATYLKTVLTNLYQLDSFNGTPTRSVMDSIGKFFRDTTGSEDPWLTTPGTAGSGYLACRRSVNMLMSDGYYNDDYSAAGDVDVSSGPNYNASNPNNYSPTQYVPDHPFTDAPNTYSNTLADVAMQYYKNDLRTDIDNKVVPISGDIAYWQHLTQFMVGLGVSGTLDSSAANKQATLKALTSGSQVWPDPGPSANSAQKIDDMWHAALNTGGDFYSVKNVSDLANAMSDAIGRSTGGDSKEAGVALSASTLVAGDLKLVPKYNSTSWNGDLEAYTLSVDANGLVTTTLAWQASTQVPTWSSRVLYTWDPLTTVGSPVSVKFTATDMGTGNLALVGPAKLVDYIRGDTSDEGVGNDYRARSLNSQGSANPLGDFINSPPVYVKSLVDLAYDKLDAGYRDYVNTKNSRTKSLVFLGGNDGILHAFNGDPDPANGGGTELYGYLPQAGLANLDLYASKDYGTQTVPHQYFVDGPVFETDAFLKFGTNAAAWTNVVMGSMGAGGRAFFALKVGTADPTASLGAGTLMWEKSSTDNTDIGYITSGMAAGRLVNGKWKAFVGNGSYSTNGKAVLFVVDLATGSIDQSLTLDSGSGNGLMGVTPLLDASKNVVAVYAGDLKGNLWRVDFNASTGTGTVGFGGMAMFKAMDASNVAQPISMVPMVVPAPSGTTGRIVVFGTGKLLTTTDADTVSQQSLYGVLDGTADGASSSSSFFDPAVNARTALLAKRNQATTTVSGVDYFTVTGTAIDWSTQHGWYFDLPFPTGAVRQRETYPGLLLNNKLAMFQTVVPAPSPGDCDFKKGDGYNYVLMAATGVQQATPAIDTNGDGKVDSSDTPVGAYNSAADGTDAVADGGSTGTLVCPAGYSAKYVTSTTGGRWVCVEPDPRPAGVTERIWRQIINPPK